MPSWIDNLGESAKRLIQPSIQQVGQLNLPDWAKNLSDGAKRLISPAIRHIGESFGIEPKTIDFPVGREQIERITQPTIPVGLEPEIKMGLARASKLFLRPSEEFQKMPQEIRKRVSEEMMGAAAGFVGGLKEVGGKKAITGLTKKELPAFQGFKDLTTKFLDYAKGKTTLSKQEILDFARRPELKKGEADSLLKRLEEFEPKGKVIENKMYGRFWVDKETGKVNITSMGRDNQLRAWKETPERAFEITPQVAEDFNKSFGKIYGNISPGQEAYSFKGDLLVKPSAKGTPKIPAQDFADSIQRDLLELKPVKVKEPQYQSISMESRGLDRYEIDELQTNYRANPPFKAKNYEEVVFESPITTNGSSHYPNSKNYFAHARGDEVVEGRKKIWREQEIQSDLLQKEGLSKAIEESVEDLKVAYQGDDVWGVVNQEGDVLQEFGGKRPTGGYYGANEARRMAEKFIADNTKQTTGFEKLMPFTNDRFGERIMRERIREKAQKGYEKYRLPTGETIGKIEGFEAQRWFPASNPDILLRQEQLKVGMEIGHSQNIADNWIITDILGEGRFKAVPKEKWSYIEKLKKDKIIKNREQLIQNELNRSQEIHDLTGKSNPQYRRYTDWGKFLKNKYGGREVTDPQGNTWVEIDLKPKYKKMPIEAYGLGAIPLMGGLPEREKK